MTVSNYKDIITSNSHLFLIAAQELGYETEIIGTKNVENLSENGFWVRHNDKACYLSGRTWYPNIPRWQLALMSDKSITTTALIQANLPTIQTITFPDNKKDLTFNEVKKVILDQPLPILIKPNDGYDGDGVILCYTKKQVSGVLKSHWKNKTSFLAQPYIRHDEYRIMVVNRKIQFIHRKKFPTVIGDGKTSLLKLLKEARYCNDIIIARQCKKLDYTLETIIPKGQIFKTHITKKSDPDFYMTENFPAHVIELTQDICTKLGIETVGIDVFIDGDINKSKKITIIELNSKPGLFYIIRYYKDYKTPLNIAKLLLRTYFR